MAIGNFELIRKLPSPNGHLHWLARCGCGQEAIVNPRAAAARRVDQCDRRLARSVMCQRCAPEWSLLAHPYVPLSERLSVGDGGGLTFLRQELVRAAFCLLAEHYPRWAEALRVSFGLDGRPALNLTEAGAVLGITSERVRQIRDAGLEKLREWILRGSAESPNAEAARRARGEKWREELLRGRTARAERAARKAVREASDDSRSERRRELRLRPRRLARAARNTP